MRSSLETDETDPKKNWEYCEDPRFQEDPERGYEYSVGHLYIQKYTDVRSPDRLSALILEELLRIKVRPSNDYHCMALLSVGVKIGHYDSTPYLPEIRARKKSLSALLVSGESALSRVNRTKKAESEIVEGFIRAYCNAHDWTGSASVKQIRKLLKEGERPTSGEQ